MGSFQCVACGSEIRRRSQNPNQKYCRRQSCQNERKRRHKEQRRKELGYREAEQVASRKWREGNPGYMRDYRKKHPAYVERNRAQQKVRNQRRRKSKAGSVKVQSQRVSAGVPPVVVIVNSDVSSLPKPEDLLNDVWRRLGAAIVKGDALSHFVSVVWAPSAMEVCMAGGPSG